MYVNHVLDSSDVMCLVRVEVVASLARHRTCLFSATNELV